jgi:hypothetical protein
MPALAAPDEKLVAALAHALGVSSAEALRRVVAGERTRAPSGSSTSTRATTPSARST